MANLPTLRQLRHLVALADCGHFGRAAAQCAITQSTLSASLKELEDLLGAPLVDRTRRGMALTPLGREIVDRARVILAEAEELVELATAQREPLSGRLHLGVIPTIGPFLLPRLWPELRARYPRLTVYLTEDLTARLIDDIRASRLDAALIALPYAVGHGIEEWPLFADPFSAVLPRGHALANRERVDPEELAAEPLLLLRDGHCLKDHVLSACRLDDMPRHLDAFEATSLSTLVHMADNGIGVTLLPALALEAGILRGTDLVAVPLAGEALAREVALIWRRGSRRAEEFRRLGALIREVFGPAP
jgi:LysR family hydrogen peroxide-inducible transcriptional activator